MKYTKWTEWLKSPEGEELFPSQASLAWYMRIHRNALIRDGLIIKLRNIWQIDGERFPNWVVGEGIRKTAGQYLNEIELSEHSFETPPRPSDYQTKF